MIYEVRAGKSSAIFNEYGCDFRDDCCFSIVLGSSFDSIDLVAHTPEDAKIWITGIRLLTRRGTLLTYFYNLFIDSIFVMFIICQNN